MGETEYNVGDLIQLTGSSWETYCGMDMLDSIRLVVNVKKYYGVMSPSFIDEDGDETYASLEVEVDEYLKVEDFTVTLVSKAK